MVLNEIEEKLYGIILSVVQSLGYDLWGIKYLGSERGGILRVYIDSPAGISISDCTEVSRHLDVVLDVEDMIPGPYTLEVSSPGLERFFFSFEQLKGYKDRMVAVKLREPLEGRKKWKGKLSSLIEDNKEVVLDAQGEKLSFNWEDIETIKLLYWEDRS